MSRICGVLGEREPAQHGDKAMGGPAGAGEVAALRRELGAAAAGAFGRLMEALGLEKACSWQAVQEERAGETADGSEPCQEAPRKLMRLDVSSGYRESDAGWPAAVDEAKRAGV